MAKNITEYNRKCLEEGSYMLYNLADYEEEGKFRPSLFNRDLLVENKELIKTIISEVPFYIHETIDDVPQTDEEIEDFLFLPDSRDSFINDVHSKLQENEFWEPWHHDAWGDEANRLLLDIYNKMRWSFITENTYMNAISLLKDDGSSIEFESDEESDAYMKEIIEAKLQNIYSLLNYNMNSSDYLNDWADSLVYSGKLTRQEADREILVYKLQDVRNEVIRRKFAGSSSLYRMLLNSIDRQGTFCGATRVGRVTGRESYSDSRLMRSVYAPWQIPFTSITSENYGDNLEELWHRKGGIPYGIFEPLFYTDDGVLRRSQGANEFSVDEPQGSLETSKVRKSYTLLRLDQVLNSASNHRHGIVYLNPSEFLTEEAWNSTDTYAVDGASSYTLKQLLIQSYGLDVNITYADACDTILHKIGEGQYNLGSAVEIIYADAVLDSMVTASIGDGYNVSNMLDITANKVLWHNNSVFKDMGAHYPYPIVDGHPVSLMDTTWIEHLKRLGEDKMRVSERVLYGAQVGEVLDLTGASTYFFYWVNDDGHLVADEFSTLSDEWVSYTVYGDEVVKTLGADTDSPYYGNSYDDNCALYREDPVPTVDKLPSTLTLDEKEEIRLDVIAENERKRNTLSRIKLLLAENHITPVRAVAMSNGVEEKTLTTTNGEATFSEDNVARYAEVTEVRGKSEVYSEIDLGTIDWTYYSASVSYFRGAIPNREGGWIESDRYENIGNTGGSTTMGTSTRNLQMCGTGATDILIRDDAHNASSLSDRAGKGNASWLDGVILRYDGTSNTLHDSTPVKVDSLGKEYSLLSKFQISWLKDNMSVWNNDNYIVYLDTTYNVVEVLNMTDTYTTARNFFRGYKIATDSASDYGTTGQSYDDTMLFGRMVYIYSSKTSYGSFAGYKIVDSKATVGLPYASSSITLPSITLIEGTVIDLVEKKVTWNWGKYDLSKAEWRRISNGFYATTSIPNVSYVNANTVIGKGISDRYTMHIGSGMTYATGCIAIDISQISVNTGGADTPEGDFIYELATPVTKTFAELGITSIDPYLIVDSNSTIYVGSEGTQAEATIHYLA